MAGNEATVTVRLQLNNQGVVTGLQQVGQQGQRTGEQLNTGATQASTAYDRLDRTLQQTGRQGRSTGEQMSQGATQASTAYSRLDITLQHVERQSQRTGQAVNTAGSHGAAGISRLDQTLATVTNAFRVAQAALAAFAVYKLTQDVVAATLRLQAFSNAMTAITGSGTLAKESMEFVAQTANRLGLNLVALESSYKNLAGSAMGTSLAGEQTEKIFTAVAKASAVLGLSADQTQGSLYAIGQMMSKGSVQAEELKGQLAERLPGAFQLAARAMGVTTSQLQKMLENGEVMASDMLPKLADELEKSFGGAAEKAGDTARASFARFGNAIENLKRALGESGIVEYLAKLADLATKAINAVTKLIEGPTANDKLRANMEQLTQLRKEEAESIRALQQQQAELQSIGNAAWAQTFTAADAQTVEVEVSARQKKIAALESENRLIIEQNKLKQTERSIVKNRVEGLKEQEQAELKKQAAQEKADKAAKEAAKTAKSAAKDAAREAERAAKEQQRILEQAEDDYKKSTLAEIDYLKEKIQSEYDLKKAAGYDLVKLDQWRVNEIQSLEAQRIDEFDKGFEAERKAAEEQTEKLKKEREQQTEDAIRAIEEQRQAYKDFVYAVEYETAGFLESWIRGGFSSALDNLKSLLTSTIADIGSKALTEPIIVPVIQSFGGVVGSSLSKMLGIEGSTATTSGFNLSNIPGLVNALSGGMETGVYNALTSGILGNVGSKIFGSAAWSGTIGTELGWGAQAASATGMTTGGIAQAIAKAAPWAAIAAIAIPLISKIFESDPEPFLRVQTTSTSSELSSGNYNWGRGEGVSPAGFDYNLTMQDIGDSAREELGAAITKLIDAQFTAIEDTLNVSVNDAIRSAQEKAGQYGAGFFSKIDLRDYEDDVEGALKALSEDLFLDIRDELVQQLTGASGTAFDSDFFAAIAVDGEGAVDTFLRFGQVVQSTDNFMEEFARQTEKFGESTYQAYQNVVTISGVMAQLSIAAASFADNSSITALEEIDATYQGLIETLKAANAATEDLDKAESYRLQELGAQITGLSATSIADMLTESINNAEPASDFLATLEAQVRQGVARAIVNSFSETLYSALLAPINSAVGEMVSSIITGGVLTGEALKAGIADILDRIDTTVAVLSDPAVAASIQGLIDAVGTITSTPAASTAAVTYDQSYVAESYSSATESVADLTDQISSFNKSISDIIAENTLDDYSYSIYQLDQWYAEQAATAQKLGVSIDGLNQAYDLQLQKINDTRQAAIDEFNKSIAGTIAENTLNDYQVSLRKLDEWYSEQKNTADELGLSLDDLNTAYDLQKQALNNDLISQYQEITATFAAAINPLNSYQQSQQDIIDKYTEIAKTFDEYGILLDENGNLTDAAATGLAGMNAELSALRSNLIDSIQAIQATITGTSDELSVSQLSKKLGFGADYSATLLTDAGQQAFLSAISGMDPSVIADYLDSVAADPSVLESLVNMLMSMQSKAADIAAAQAEKIADFNSATADIIAENTLSDYALQLRDLDKWYAEQKATAEELGLSLDDLNRAYELQKQAADDAEAERVAAELAELQEKITDFNSSIADIIAENTLSDLDQSLRSINQWYAEQKTTAEELGLSLGDLNRAYDLQIEAARKAAVETVRSAYRSALSDALSDAQEKQNELESAYTDAKSTYISVLQQEISAQKETTAELESTISSFENLAESLKTARDELARSELSGGSPEQIYAQSGLQLDALMRDIWSGDSDKMIAAMQDLPGVSNDFLAASQSRTANYQEYLRDVAKVQAYLSTAEGIASTRKTTEELALEQSTAQTESLQAILESLQDQLPSMAVAEAAYQAAKTALDSSHYKEQISYYQGQIDRLDLIIDGNNSIASALANYQAALTAAISAGNSQYADELSSLNSSASVINAVNSASTAVDRSLYDMQGNAFTDTRSNQGATYDIGGVTYQDNGGTHGGLGYDTIESIINSGLKDAALADALIAASANTGLPSDIFDRYVASSRLSFSTGGTVSGSDSGYMLPVTFHGTEHITPDSQMTAVKEALQDLKEICMMLLNTAGEGRKDAQQIIRRIDDALIGKRTVKVSVSEAA